MQITTTIQPANRAAWRDWLEQHHDQTSEIWLVTDKRQSHPSYLETVEEALCFGWIDGIAKRVDAHKPRSASHRAVRKAIGRNSTRNAPGG